jgi:hypothetical protein
LEGTSIWKLSVFLRHQYFEGTIIWKAPVFEIVPAFGRHQYLEVISVWKAPVFGRYQYFEGTSIWKVPVFGSHQFLSVAKPQDVRVLYQLDYCAAYNSSPPCISGGHSAICNLSTQLKSVAFILLHFVNGSEMSLRFLLVDSFYLLRQIFILFISPF